MGFTQYMSSTVVETPCISSSAAASQEGFTISPQAMMATSVPWASQVARSISNGQLVSE